MGSVGMKYTTGALLEVPATEIVALHLWLKKITGGSPQISQKEGKIIILIFPSCLTCLDS